MKYSEEAEAERGDMLLVTELSGEARLPSPVTTGQCHSSSYPASLSPVFSSQFPYIVHGKNQYW